MRNSKKRKLGKWKNENTQNENSVKLENGNLEILRFGFWRIGMDDELALMIVSCLGIFAVFLLWLY